MAASHDRRIPPLRSQRVHTVRREGVWTNEVEGEGTRSRHRTKDEAAAAGQELALTLGAEHVIHNVDGSVGARTRYSAELRGS
jgi:hypothetical protein